MSDVTTAGWDDLHRAAGNGDPARVADLLAAGVDPVRRTGDGRTAYEIALAAGHVAVARTLRTAEDAVTEVVPDRRWRPYCRAYPLARLREFAGWPATASDDAAPPEDDDVVYLHDDLTVTRSAWPGEDVLFDRVSPEWEHFCRWALEFAVPDELEFAVPADGSATDAP
jgi:ankyrin repeat protein